jgi:uncharacterized protein (TIGR02246 family)
MTARRVFMIGALALAGAPVAFAQSTDTLKLRDDLMALEKAGWVYLRDRNYDGVRDYMADDGLWIFGDGSRYNKRQTLEMMKDFSMGDVVIEPTYAVRVLSPDVATLLYRVTYTSKLKDGKPETSKVLSSSVYVRRDGKWWSVLYQESPIP